MENISVQYTYLNLVLIIYRRLTPVSNIKLLLFFFERIRPSSGVFCVLILHSCLTLCNPMDCSPPGSSVHGILQARILEWVAISSSRGSIFQTQRLNLHLLSLLHWQMGSLPLSPPGKPITWGSVNSIWFTFC